MTSLPLQTIVEMHEDSVAHLDITFSNIMMQKDTPDPFDQIRVIDFGLASICRGRKFVTWSASLCDYLLPVQHTQRKLSIYCHESVYTSHACTI